MNWDHQILEELQLLYPSKLSQSQLAFIKNISTHLSKIFVLFSWFRKKGFSVFLFHIKSCFRSGDNAVFVIFLLPSIVVRFEGAIEAEIITMLWIGLHIQYNTDNSKNENQTFKKSNWFCVLLKPKPTLSHKTPRYIDRTLVILNLLPDPSLSISK